MNATAASAGEASPPEEVAVEPVARDRILAAACDLIASDGIDEVRIARVATRARASTALVHHYFSTRAELLTDALLRTFDLAAAQRFDSDVEPADETAARPLSPPRSANASRSPAPPSASGCCGWSCG